LQQAVSIYQDQEKETMNIKALVERHPLVSYFVLAYGITWGSIFAFLASRGFQFASLQIQDTSILFVIIFLAMLLGPSTSGLVLTAVLDGRNGLRELWLRIRCWQVSLPWYAVALLTVPTLTLMIFSTLGMFAASIYAPSFRIALGIAGLAAGCFEEIGWTGFATPRLINKHNPLKAGFILGILWACWHMLADFSGNISSLSITEWIAWFVIYWILPLTAYRILMTWVYSQTQSVFLGQLMHASYTGWLIVLSPDTPKTDLLWEAIFAVILWILVGLIALSQRQVVRDDLLQRKTAS
jgi:membrane protease YdiL (CAAX protease family)